jgi:hypothetical protein
MLTTGGRNGRHHRTSPDITYDEMAVKNVGTAGSTSTVPLKITDKKSPKSPLAAHQGDIQKKTAVAAKSV